MPPILQLSLCPRSGYTFDDFYPTPSFMNNPHDVFQSPFSWRYGSDEMRALWSETHKRRLWRKIWVELARAQQTAGLVSAEQVADLEAHAEQIDIERAEQHEAEIRHDLMAEVKTFAEQCKIGGGIIHLGATSADIEDNADAIRIRESLSLITQNLVELLVKLCEKTQQLSDIPVIAFTHLQPAEPTTMGYRLAVYLQDLWADYGALNRMRSQTKGKGFKGAVGTRASYTALLEGTTTNVVEFERAIMQHLDLSAFDFTTQTYPRRQDWEVLTVLSGIALSLYRFAFDFRLLQSPLAGEWAEPFGASQVGSSAMPFKRNPINAEKMDSLGRLVESLVSVAWNNAAHSLLERTLDDSANRREILPVAFLAVDEMVTVATRLITGLQVNREAAARNLERYGAFAATERVLMAAARSGADRQVAHEHLREQSLVAWQAVNRGEPNPLPHLLQESEYLRQYLAPERIVELMEANQYIGDAPERARELVRDIRLELFHYP